MKVSQAVDLYLQYHQVNSKENAFKTCEFVLTRFAVRFEQQDPAIIYHEEVLEFLLSLSKSNKQDEKGINIECLHRSSILASTLDTIPHRYTFRLPLTSDDACYRYLF